MDVGEPAKEELQDNLARLRSHLKKDSLAEKLTSARVGTGTADPAPVLRKVVLDRIEELRRGHEPVPDQQA